MHIACNESFNQLRSYFLFRKESAVRLKSRIFKYCKCLLQMKIFQDLIEMLEVF